MRPYITLFVIVSTIAAGMAALFWFSVPTQIGRRDSSLEVLVEHIDVDSAEEILTKIVSAYANAKYYRDDAKLNLSYRLHGRYMAEPHSWSVTFKGPNRLSAKLFNARVRQEDSEVVCFIYDFDSGNLDNQHLVTRTSEGSCPIRAILDDKIARHFVTGDSELPFNRELVAEETGLLPPTLFLLNGRQLPAWLGDPESMEVINDGEIRLTKDQLNYQIVFDPKSYLITQIRYPVELLDAKLHAHPDVLDLSLIATFDNATTTPPEPSTAGEFNADEDAKFVNTFVAVPEPFPTGMIGKAIPSLEFRTTGGVYDNSIWKGKVTLLHWLSIDSFDNDSLVAINELRKKFDRSEYEMLIVLVVDGDFESRPDLHERFATIAQNQNCDVCVDVGFSNGQALGLEGFPATLVIDRENNLQYASSGDDEAVSVEEISGILYRVRSGDDVAAEMLEEYEGFLDAYHEQLEAARR